MAALVYIMLCLIWGSTWMAIKLGMQDAPPMYTLLIRFVMAVALLHAIVLIRKLPYPKSFREFLRIGYPGLFMFAGSYLATYNAERFISSALTAVLYASIPFFIALFSIWLLKSERLGLRAWIGLVLGFAGILLISRDQFGESTELFVGTLLAIGGALCSSLATVLLKRAQSSRPVLVTVAVQMLIGMIPILILTPIMEDASDIRFTAQTIGTILYLAIPGTVLSFISYYWLLKRMRAVVVSLMSFIIPLIAIFIGTVFFGETLSGGIIPGTALILVAVLLVVRGQGAKPAVESNAS